jgi:GNAT superfamily N-acetyltransferase
MELITISYNEFTITTDKAMLQPEAVHSWLSSKSYWAKNIPYERVKISFDNSFCIGALKDGVQIAYARLVTDYASFAYLADVYVEETYRGLGLSKKMMNILLGLDWVRSLRRIMLATVDAKGLYIQYGFSAPKFPERLMEINRPGIYGDPQNICQ